MRIFKLSTLALVMACLALVPAASATTLDILVGTTVVGTATLSSSGSCGSATIGSGQVCLTVNMTGGNALRFGGDVIGLSGNVDTTGDDTTTIAFDSSGLLGIPDHKCNANLGSVDGQNAGVCITAGSGANATTLSVLLTNADISTGITLNGFHIIGPACGTEQTCFTTGTSVVPEPGTLGLLGTGLLGIAGLVRRRFVK